MYVQTSSRVIPLKTTDIIYTPDIIYTMCMAVLITANKNAQTGAQQMPPVSRLACGREDATSTTQSMALQCDINLAVKDTNLPKNSNTVKWTVAQVCQPSKLHSLPHVLHPVNASVGTPFSCTPSRHAQSPALRVPTLNP